MTLTFHRNDAAALLSEVDSIQLVSIHPDTAHIEGRDFATDKDAAIAWAETQNAAGCNLYWTVNRIAPGVNKKPAKSDIIAARFLHVDIDPPKDGSPFCKETAALLLRADATPPCLILDSGGGIQAFWRLDEPATDFAQVEAANRSIEAAHGGDACHNIDRIMRLPGSVNWPSPKKRAAGRVPALATILHTDNAQKLSTAQVATLAASAPHLTVASVAEIDIAGWEPQSCESLEIAPDSALAKAISAPAGEDRSGDTFSAACAGLEGGFTTREIAGLLLNPENEISGHCLAQPCGEERAAIRALARATAHLGPRGIARGRLQRDPTHQEYLEMTFGKRVYPRHDATPASAALLTAKQLVWREPSHIPPRDWVYGRQLLRGVISLVVAPGGLGKSSLTVAMAVALATGQPLLGSEIWKGRKRVWLFGLEDSSDEMTRSIAATCKHYQITEPQLAGQMYVNSAMDGDELCLATQSRDGAKIMEPTAARLTAELIEKQIDVLIVDPFVSSHKVTENDNPAIDAVAKRWAKIAADANCAILLVHHSRKLNGEEVDANSARGAVSLIDAARIAITLNRMSLKEAAHMGASDEDRVACFRTFNAKANRSPPASSSDWFRLQSVSLDNAPGGGDSIGVVTPWTPPEISFTLSNEKVQEVQDIVAGGTYRKSDRSPDWVGKAIAESVGLDAKTQKSPITKIIEALINDSYLKITLKKDSNRIEREYLCVGASVKSTDAK